MAAAAAATALGVSLDAVVEGVEALKRVPGRLEPVKNRAGLALVVDYAHTPDALLKSLQALRPHVAGRIITIFGCGGDRDRGKRFEMGLVAGRGSDVVFITSDNPRSEDPASIVEEAEKGVIKAGLEKKEWPHHAQATKEVYFTEVDRREAIRKAVRLARGEDLVLIAGKGHEDYQIIGNEKRHFSDQEEAASGRGESSMSAKWGEITAAEVLASLGGELVRGFRKQTLSWLQLRLEKHHSRTVCSGRCKGEKLTAMILCPRQSGKGAAGAVIRNGFDPVVPADSDAAIIAVRDTLRALGDMSSWWRHEHKAWLSLSRAAPERPPPRRWRRQFSP
jgi:hypothetical protein